MAILSLRNIHHSFGGPVIFDDASISVEAGDRIGLVGRNGAGKSTLLRFLAGQMRPDKGALERADGLRVTSLTQDLPGHMGGTVFDVIARGFGASGEDLIALLKGDEANGEADVAWSIAPKIDMTVSKLSLDPNQAFDTLSGGMKRRVLLARAIATSPDVLLLDEPTNHLDISAVEWLEEFLLREQITLVFVTHDRAFLQKLATRIAEVDRGKLLLWDCDYRTWIERREQYLADEAARNARMDKLILAESVWANRNVEARRTKSVGRLKELERLRADRAERRNSPKVAQFTIQSAEKSGKLVADLKHATFSWPDGRDIVRDLTTSVIRGDRIGIIGRNGAGKTTLVRLLLGSLEPTSGSVRLGSNVQVAYFDQQREQLDESRTVFDTIGDGNDRVSIGGRDRHVHGYLRDFLFDADRALVKVHTLSGGERNRLLLARLFMRPSNVLVLDEPTNDLDFETLELLEEKLAEYDGTVLLVTHDRAFLNDIVTSTLVFEADGVVAEYIGGYDDWLRQRPKPKAAQERAAEEKSAKAEAAAAAKTAAKKLSFAEKRELETLPQKLAELETKIAATHATLADPEFYVKRAGDAASVHATLERDQAELEMLMERWLILEELAAAGKG